MVNSEHNYGYMQTTSPRGEVELVMSRGNAENPNFPVDVATYVAPRGASGRPNHRGGSGLSPVQAHLKMQDFLVEYPGARLRIQSDLEQNRLQSFVAAEIAAAEGEAYDMEAARARRIEEVALAVAGMDLPTADLEAELLAQGPAMPVQE